MSWTDQFINLLYDYIYGSIHKYDCTIYAIHVFSFAIMFELMADISWSMTLFRPFVIVTASSQVYHNKKVIHWNEQIRNKNIKTVILNYP